MSSYNYRSNGRPNTNNHRSGGRKFAPRNNRRMGQYIDPSRFVKAAKPVEQAEYIAKYKFSDFAVDDLIKRNVVSKGYTTPTPIQDQTIAVALEGKDVIGIASTGTGKTAAFALPMLTKLIQDRNSRALIIAPTRELAQQIEDECRSLAKGSGLSGSLLIGGTQMGPQLRDLAGNPNIVVGTPGRIKDHIERRTLKIAGFNMVVLDEVDRMLDMGFIDDV